MDKLGARPELVGRRSHSSNLLPKPTLLVETRKRYDALLFSCTLHGARGAAGFFRSHPAQIVSLEEFSRQDGEKPTISGGDSKDQGGEVGSSDPTYAYPCRCGGMYQLTADDLENGYHLVGCEGCSEVIWVGYEEIDRGEGDAR